MLRSTQRRTAPAQLTASPLSTKPMNPAQIDAAFRDWWYDSYKRPPTAQALMTHVAFAEHVLALAEVLEVEDD